MKATKNIILSAVLVISKLSMAAEPVPADSNLVTRTITVVSSEPNLSLARAKLMQQAVDQVSQNMIQEIIGESKYSRNRDIIQSKIVRHSSTFIPYSKVGDLSQSPQGTKLTLTMQLDVDHLQKLLLQNGLFYESDANPAVLPVIRWVDKGHLRSYAWWNVQWQGQNGGDVVLQKYSQLQEEALAKAFAEKSFYLLKPTQNLYGTMLPQQFQLEKLSLDDLQILGPLYGTQISVEGRVELTGSFIQISLLARQIVSGRVIGEVVRKLAINQEDRSVAQAIESSSADLVSQVYEAWQRGSIGAMIYRLVVRGNFGPLFAEKTRESLQSRLRQIKSVKPRSISAGVLVFELESNLDLQAIAKGLGELQIDNLRLVLDSIGDRELIYRLIK